MSKWERIKRLLIPNPIKEGKKMSLTERLMYTGGSISIEGHGRVVHRDAEGLFFYGDPEKVRMTEIEVEKALKEHHERNAGYRIAVAINDYIERTRPADYDGPEPALATQEDGMNILEDWMFDALTVK